MGMQQLDLFASFEAQPPVQQKPVDIPQVAEEAPVPVNLPQPVIESVAAVVAAVLETKEPLPVKENTTVVFADDKISVKIKPKIAVQQSKPVERKESVAVKTKSKRGRKSYKEIDAEVDLIDIPEDEVLNQKMYYSITEVAKWFRVNASLLRYWENEFDILKPRKNRKGDRLFRPEDIRNLQVIYYLLRNRKFSLEGARKYLRNNRHQADVNVQLSQSLTKFRSFLLELKANLGA